MEQLPLRSMGIGAVALFALLSFWGVNGLNHANVWVELPPHYMTAATLDTEPVDPATLPDSPLKPVVEEREDIALRQRLQGVMDQFPAYLRPHLYYTHLRSGRYVNINADEPVAAASVIKLPILFTWCQAVDEKRMSPDDNWLYDAIHQTGGSGTLQYKPPGFPLKSIDVATLMIQESDNTSTNMFIDYMGGMDVMNQRFTRLGLPGTGVRNWLPDLGGTNTISPKAMARLLYNLAKPGTLSEPTRAMALEILQHIHNNRLIPAGLPHEAVVAHKTGDIGSSLGDSALVTLPDGDQYILSVQVERPHNDGNAKPMIVALSRAVYDYHQEQALRDPSTLARASIRVPGELQ